jgi:hypothetical protein
MLSLGEGICFVTKVFSAVYVAAFVIRLFYILTFSERADFFAEDDSGLYWQLSGDIWNALTSHTLRTPGYPIFLWACRLVDDAPRFVAVVQAAFDAATCVIIARLGMCISMRTGAVAGGLAAISASLVIYSSQMLSDTLTIFFQTIGLLAIVLYLEGRGLKALLIAGMSIGIGILFRPSVLMLTPFIAAVLMVRDRGLRATLIFGTVVGLFVSPLILRNVFLFDRFALTSVGGEHLLNWIDPLARQRQDGTPYFVTREKNGLALAAAVSDSPEAQKNPFIEEDIKLAIAKSDLSKISPLTIAKLWVEGGLLNLVSPATIGDPRVRTMKEKPSFYATPGQSVWSRAVQYIASSNRTYLVALAIGAIWSLSTLVLACFGFITLLRSNAIAAALLAIPIVYCLGITGPVASAKYRLPMEPSLILLAAAFFSQFAKTTQAKSIPSAL